MSQSYPNSPLAFVGSIHGNEFLGRNVHKDINNNLRLPGLVSTEGHPEALDQGVRYLGNEGEMGGLFPGDISSPNPDRRQAARLHKWLTDMDPWLTVSAHNNEGLTPGSEFVGVGDLTTPAALAVAHVLGMNNVTVNPQYAFHKHRSGLAETEHVTADDTTNRELVAAWRSWLTEIVERGPEGMAELFSSGPELNYFVRSGWIQLIENGKPNEPILEMLEELETATVGTIERFQPIRLSDEIKRRLGFAGIDAYFSSWDYQNMSREAPQLGRSARSGVVRREVMGGYYFKISPPQPTHNGMLTFTRSVVGDPV